MATILTVSGTHTPNEGRVIWNNNFTNLNGEVVGLSSLISAVTGDIVGTTATQTLQNKTISSLNRGGNNSIIISRKDLENTSFLLVTSDSGSVSDINVTAASPYSLKIFGSDSITTYVSSNTLYIKNKEICILNEPAQVLGVKVASVLGGNVAQFGGNVIINNFLAVGAGHTAAANAEIHIKDATPELRIETTGTEAYLNLTDSVSNFKFTADLNSETLSLTHDNNSIVSFRDDNTTITSNVIFSKVGGTHTIYGNINVLGVLTASGLVATATDVVINNGPVTISGGQSYIKDNSIDHQKLKNLTSGYLLIGNSSNIPTATPLTGAISLTNTGVTSINDGAITLPKLSAQTLNTFLMGNDTGVVAKSLNSNSDVILSSDSNTFTLSLKSGVIIDADISPSAAINMSKTAFTVNISGLRMNGNSLELDSTVKPDIFFRSVPVGTIIPYAGNKPVLSGSVEDEVIPGWLHCNGWLVNNSKYPELYSTLGTAWGSAGKLPDLRGAFLRGVDVDRGLDPDYATRTGGGTSVKVGSFQDDALQAHTHSFIDNYYQLADQWAQGGGGLSTVRPVNSTLNGVSDTTDSTGGLETRPVNYAVIYLIKY